MKKSFLFVIGCASCIWAAPRSVTFTDVIGPATGTSYYTSIASSTVNGSRLCLTDLRVSVSRLSAQTNITVSVLESGTTVYAVDSSTATAVNEEWNEGDALCISPNRPMAITVVPASGTPTVNVNYKGYAY